MSLLWYIPKIEVAGEVDASEAPGLITFANGLSEQFKRTVKETHASDDMPPAEAAEADDGWNDGSKPLPGR